MGPAAQRGRADRGRNQCSELRDLQSQRRRSGPAPEARWSAWKIPAPKRWDRWCCGLTERSSQPEQSPAALRPHCDLQYEDQEVGSGSGLPKGQRCNCLLDAPAALEINGNVIVMTGRRFLATGAVFFEWNGTKLTKIPGPPNASQDASFYRTLPRAADRTVAVQRFHTEIEVFTPKGTYNAAWQPKITSVPSTITHGKTYVVKGTQFSGFTNGAAYGDDFQDCHQLRPSAYHQQCTKHVFYARTTNPSSYAVQTGSTPESTHFTVSASTETGASTLVVVTNGIPSAAKLGDRKLVTMQQNN